MSRSHGSPPERNLQDTRDELTEASIALNTAYDRLQDLRTSLRNFTAQRDRLAGVRRASQQPRPQSRDVMGPDHSAIVLSDSEEESELDVEGLRDSLPSRILELTSRWDRQHAPLNTAARQDSTSESSNVPFPSSVASTDQPRPIYPQLRRRRAPTPSGTSSRDAGGAIHPSSTPARRSFLETHLRQLRYASNPGEPSTTLGRRVTQRAAAAQAATSQRHVVSPSPDPSAPADTAVRSTLPLGLEHRSSPPPHSFNPLPRPIESRAATHLRHSLLPNPSSGIRSTSVRGGSINGAYTRFIDRAEHRPRTARSNSFTALNRNASTPNLSHQVAVEEPQPPLASLGAVYVDFTDDEDNVNFIDPLSANYRIRRQVNAQGEERVFNINWSELMSEGDRDEDLSDPAAWMRPPRRLPPLGRPSRTQPEPDTDDTIGHDTSPATSRETRSIGRENGARRRRGWARLDPDGDEISTEDEASLERIRTELRLPRTRSWGRSGTAWAAGRGSTVAVLDFVHHNSRDATTGHRDPNSPLDAGAGDGDVSPRRERSSNHILDSLFHSLDPSYVSPLPVHSSHKSHSQYPPEVRVAMDVQMVGR